MTDGRACDDTFFVIANRFAIKKFANRDWFQAKRCGNPPECKKANRLAALVMTNGEACDAEYGQETMQEQRKRQIATLRSR